MSQTSFFWGATGPGDGTLAPYTDDEFTDVTRSMLQFNRSTSGVLPLGAGPLGATQNPLSPSNPSGTTIRVGLGNALVDGKLFHSDNTEDFAAVAPGAGSNYYTVVLRKDFAAQTVRLAMLGPNTVSPPTVTQTDGTTWEISIATVQVTSAGVVTITDTRAPALAPGSGIIKIAETVLTASAASVDFTSIPPIYRHLRIEVNGRGDAAGVSGLYVTARFNGDSAANYDYTELAAIADGTVSSSGAVTTADMRIMQVTGGLSLANASGGGVMEIPNYRSTTFNKQALGFSAGPGTGGTTATMVLRYFSGFWRNTAAINRVELLPIPSTGGNFIAGSVFTLYGIV